MKEQIKNIVKFMEGLAAQPEAQEIEDIIGKLHNDRMIVRAVNEHVDGDEMNNLLGRRLLQRLGYDDKDKIYRETAQLGLMISGAFVDKAYLERNPGAEDMGYTRSNLTYGNQCGHWSDRPTWCSVCGKDTKEFTGMSVAEMMDAHED